MIRRILCPTDFASLPDHTVEYAAHLAKAAGAKLTVLHAQKNEGALAEIVHHDSTVDEVEERLREECKRISRVHHIECNCEVEPPIHNVKQWIAHRSDSFDLLIIGNKNADTMDQVLFGNPALQMVKKTRVPVLIVPDGFEYRPITRIIYAYDYKSKKIPPIAQLESFANLFNTQVCFLTVVKKYSEEMEAKMDQLFASIESQWQSDHTLIFDYVYYPDVVESLNHFYQIWSDNDLMVLSARHHNFIYESLGKSVLKEVTRIAWYPLLVIHE